MIDTILGWLVELLFLVVYAFTWVAYQVGRLFK
jgi:hypothetical protein